MRAELIIISSPTAGRHDLGFITRLHFTPVRRNILFYWLGSAKDVQLGVVYFSRNVLSFNLNISQVSCILRRLAMEARAGSQAG